MLIINGFINGKSSVNYQSKPDKVSFKAAIPKEVLMSKEVEKMESVYLKKFPDIFGASFNKKFLDPWNKFLAKQGVKISYSKDTLILPANDFIMKDRRVENAVAAELVDKDGHNIIYNPSGWKGIREPIKGATNNDAAVNLLYSLTHNKMEMNDGSIGFPNPLKNVEIPQKLRDVTEETAMTLRGVKDNWEINVDDTTDKGGSFLKQVLIRLMPEGQVQKTASKSLNMMA